VKLSYSCEEMLLSNEEFAYYVLLPLLMIPLLGISVFGLLKRSLFVALGIIFTTILVVACVVVGFVYEWFPDVGVEECEGEFCYCEEYQVNSTILQPVAVVSDFAYINAGLLVLYLSSTKDDSSRKKPNNPMVQKNSPYALMLGLIIIYLGPASMAYHSSIKIWAVFLDGTSMFLWLLFCIWYSLQRIYKLTRKTFALGFVVCLIGSCLIIQFVPTVGKAMTAIWGGVLTSLEAVVIYLARVERPWKGVSREPRYYFLMVGSFLLAMAFWLPTGGVVFLWCPTYVGHMFWHIFTAITTFLAYPYYASEVRKGDDVVDVHIRVHAVESPNPML